MIGEHFAVQAMSLSREFIHFLSGGVLVTKPYLSSMLNSSFGRQLIELVTPSTIYGEHVVRRTRFSPSWVFQE